MNRKQSTCKDEAGRLCICKVVFHSIFMVILPNVVSLPSDGLGRVFRISVGQWFCNLGSPI